MSEDFQHKLDLVIEGQQMIGEKVDRLETRMDRLEVKVAYISEGEGDREWQLTILLPKYSAES